MIKWKEAYNGTFLLHHKPLKTNFYSRESHHTTLLSFSSCDQFPSQRRKTYTSIYHHKTTIKSPKRNYKLETAKLCLLCNRNMYSYNRYAPVKENLVFFLKDQKIHTKHNTKAPFNSFSVLTIFIRDFKLYRYKYYYIKWLLFNHIIIYVLNDFKTM